MDDETLWQWLIGRTISHISVGTNTSKLLLFSAPILGQEQKLLN